MQYEFLVRAVAEDDGADTCRDWPYSTNGRGYGRVWIPILRHSFRSHVVAYALAYGWELPVSFIVRHSCDNPRCFRIRHLLAGTQKDNVHDAIARGRFLPKGSHHNMAKLTESQVLSIRHLYASKAFTQKNLGEMFQVSRTCIQGVVERRKWQHI